MRLRANSTSDLMFALRILLRDPVVTVMSLVTLSLTLGISASAFSLFRGGVLDPLPYPNSSDLVAVTVETTRADGERRVGLLDSENFEVWRDHSLSLRHLSAYRVQRCTVDVRQPEKLAGAAVSEDLFAALEVAPRLGRWLRAEDVGAGAEPTVVLSFSFWRSRFDEDLSVLGRPLLVDGSPHTIVGVMPEGFFFPERKIDLWLPLKVKGLSTSSENRIDREYLQVLARLSPGYGLEQAASEGESVLDGSGLLGGSPGVGEDHPAQVHVTWLTASLVSSVRFGLVAILAAACFLLVIGAGNLVALTLARLERRRDEMTLRSALGASPGRLVRQGLVETLTLVGAGGVGGLGVAVVLLRWLPRWLPSHLQRLAGIEFDGPTFLFGLIASVAVGAVIAIPTLLRPLQAGRSLWVRAEGAGDLRLRRALVVGEVALAMIVLVGAGLMLQSFTELSNVELGYRPEGVLAASLELGKAPGTTADPGATYDVILSRLATEPSITAVGAIQFLPLAQGFSLVSLDLGHERGSVLAIPQWTSPGYLAAAGLHLEEGRWLSQADHDLPNPIVVVNQEFARQYLAGGSAVGETLSLGSKTLRVVGTVENVPTTGLTAKARPTFFASYHLASALVGGAPGRLSLALRTAGDPRSLAPVLRTVVADAAPGVPLEDVATLGSSLAESLAVPRLYAGLLGLFAVVSLVLALGGVFGLLSYWVARCRREVGIRKALGAGRGEIVRTVAGSGMRLVVVGVLAGALAAAALSSVLGHLLFGVSPLDPWTFASAGMVFLVVGACACSVPALRASRVDPMTELRQS